MRTIRLWSVGLGLAALVACDERVGPDAGEPTSMRVSISVTGGDHDLDGFVVLVDGQPRGTTSTSLEITGLTPGTHEVTLSGIAPNCDLQGTPVRSVVLPSLSYFAASFQVVCLATGIDIGNVTTGIDYGTAYAVQVGSLPEVPLGVNARTTLGRMPPGRHSVMLKLDPALTNCQVDGAATREVDVVFRAVAPLTFGVTCLARFGSIQVILQVTGADGDATSYLASVDDGTPRRLSPNGMVVFDSMPGGDHTVRISGGSANCSLTGSSQVITSVPVGSLGRPYVLVEFSASCAELERRIAFTRNPFDAPHWGYDPFVAIASDVGGNLVLLAAGAAPSWSPDGLRVAFVRIPNGCYYGCISQGISLIKRDGSGLVYLTDGSEDWNPAWSPNGTKIAFQRNGILMVMNANGTSPAPVPNLQRVTNGGDPDWSPDGTRLAFTCEVDSNNGDICVINTDGTGFVRLTLGSSADNSPAWSRDGTRLLFSTTQFASGAVDLGVMNADGTGLTRVTQGETSAWSPDGTRIYFSRSGALYSVKPDGSDLRPIIGNGSGWNYAPAVR